MGCHLTVVQSVLRSSQSCHPLHNYLDSKWWWPLISKLGKRKLRRSAAAANFISPSLVRIPSFRKTSINLKKKTKVQSLKAGLQTSGQCYSFVNNIARIVSRLVSFYGWIFPSSLPFCQQAAKESFRVSCMSKNYFGISPKYISKKGLTPSGDVLSWHVYQKLPRIPHALFRCWESLKVEWKISAYHWMSKQLKAGLIGCLWIQANRN